jgi:AraC-like DNA-binding protein
MDETGFSSRSYFAQKFKEKYGVTPKQFQQKKLAG